MANGIIRTIDSTDTVAAGAQKTLHFTIYVYNDIYLSFTQVGFAPDVPSGWTIDTGISIQSPGGAISTTGNMPTVATTGGSFNYKVVAGTYQVSYTVSNSSAVTGSTPQFGLTYLNSSSATFDTTAHETLTVGTAGPPAPTLDAASDSNIVGDGVTSSLTPTVNGAGATANAVIKLYDTDGTTLLGTTTADGSGNWHITPTVALTEASHTLKATQTVGSDISGLSAGLTLTIDATAPVTPNAPMRITSATDTGVSLFDGITKNISPTVAGAAAESGSTITLYDTNGSTVLGIGTVTAGNYSIALTTALSEGSHTITAVASDVAGNVSGRSAGLVLEIDTTAPTGLALSTTTVSSRGAHNGSNLATISATDVHAVTYALVSGDGSNDADNAKFTISGNSLVTAQDLSVGTYHIYVKATDAAGNDGLQTLTISVADGPDVISIVREAAAPSTVPVASTSVVYTVTFSEAVTGVDTTDFTLTPTGNATGAISNVTTTDNITYTVTVNGLGGDGTLGLSLNASGTAIQNGGSHAIIGGYTSGETYTLDHTAPASPSVPTMSSATDTGAANNDAITSNTSPVFTGTGEIGSTVKLYDASNGDALIGSATVDGTGHYSVTPSTPLAAGAHQLYAQATDAAANTSALTTNLAVFIDTAAPTAILLPNSTVYINAGLNAVIDTLGATDAGGSGALSYQLAPGRGSANNADFTITNGVLTINDPSATGAGVESIRVMATDAAGNSFTQVLEVNVISGPSISSIARASAASATVPGADNSVVYSVTFSELVSGVGVSDFSVHGSGATGTVASVTDTGDGIHYLVTVNGISGDGTLRLDLNASGTGIQNASNTAVLGGYTSGQTYTIDRTAPALPSAPVMTAGTDTGASSSDAITSNPSPVFTGTGEIGSTVKLYDASNSNAVIGSATVDGTGHYSITPSAPLTAGAHQLYAQASDAAANTSAHTANLAVAIDTAAPTAILLPNATVLTNAGLNAVVGTLGATDAGGSGALSYQLVAGVGDTGNAAFTLTNGVLTINDPNAAGVAVESIRVRVTDAAGNSYAQVLEVHVSAPPDPTPPTVDGVPVTTAPVTLPGGGSGTTVTIPVVTAGQGTTDGAANVADIPLATANASAILTAQVPVGTGLTATGGASQPAGNSLAELIGAIKAQTLTHDAADQGHLAGNGTHFLGLLSDNVPLLISTVVVSNVDATASTPLTLTGTSTASQHTALVIDTSQLPGNSDIVLNHVDFAAVVGKATITGNTAGQVITGDAASQHVIVSTGTASQVYAGGGSDVLQYGQPATALAANHLEGGAPQAAVAAIVPNSSTAGSLTAATAILLNGGTGADTASFAKAQSAYTIDQRDGYVLITDNSDATQRVTVTNVETLQFKDSSVAVQSRDALSTIAGLYENVLGRQADIGGFDFWGAAQAKGASLGAIAVGMLNSAEAVSRGYGLNGDATHDINTLYQAVLGRAADAGGLAFWKDALAHGYTIVDVANGFTASAEIVGHKLAATSWDLAF